MCVVNQQKNVLQGKRLFIDRKAGTSRLETPAEGGQPAGRIAATFYQNDTQGRRAAEVEAEIYPDHKDGAVQDGVLGSFKMDPNAPMDVEADTLDVHDNEKRAVFRGNVKSKQGDFVVRTIEMIAFYSGQDGWARRGGDEAADKTPAQLTRVEAKQKVLIISKDGQTATGDWAIFDTKANTVLMGDDVTVSRGKDVAQGPRLKIDLTTGMYRFELEQEPAVAPAAPATSASPAAHGPGAALEQPGGTRMCAWQAVPARLSEGCAGQGQGRGRQGPSRVSRRQDGRGLAAEHQRQPDAAGRLTHAAVLFQGEEAQTPRRGADGGRAQRARGGAKRSRDGSIEPYGGPGWLTVVNVKKTYRNRMVVKGVSLETGRGEAVGLLGPNGAGKTTVFYMVTGLVPADAGQVTLDGRDVTRLPMYRRARLGIGYLPQEASIFRGLTVEQNIMAVLELVEPKRKRRKEQLDSLLEEFNITRLRKSPSLALSGGERRRCEIARALASRPSFMLLDEPFAGIDPLAVGDIQQLVRQLTARGIGVLITDHNVRETLSLVDRAYIIYDGQVLTHGNPREIIANEDVRRVYLGDMFG